jgi:hypothetical protein
MSTPGTIYVVMITNPHGVGARYYHSGSGDWVTTADDRKLARKYKTRSGAQKAIERMSTRISRDAFVSEL